MCDVKKSITVPTTCIGKIIGKGGSNIRALETDTQAKVQISKDKSGADTVITLVGTDDQICDVEARIRQLTVNDRGPPRSFGRPSNTRYNAPAPQTEPEYNWDDDATQPINSQTFTQKRRDFPPREQNNDNWGYSQNNQQGNDTWDNQTDTWGGNTECVPQQQSYGNNTWGSNAESVPQQTYTGNTWGNNQVSVSQPGYTSNDWGTSEEQVDWNSSQSNERSSGGGRGNNRNYDNKRFSRGDGNNRPQRSFNDRSSQNQSYGGGNSYNRSSRNQYGGDNSFNKSYGGDNSYNKSYGDDKQSSETYNAGNSQPAQFDMKALNEEYEKAQEKYWATFPPVKKIFYEELPEVANMSPQDVEIYRKSLNDLVIDRPLEDGSKKPIPNPVKTFEQAFHNYPEILGEIKKVGFVTPSPIQCQSWPVIMSGEDMIGIAQTGTGKTLAFLLPALIHIDNQTLKPEFAGKPSALVLAPTRELALQIHKEVNKYSYRNIKSLCIYGGADRRAQIAELQQGVHIIIATPGRLDDLVLAGHINPEVITYVVLDEADRMLDMGFEPQIRKTLYKVRPDRQTVMTSATWPNGVRRLAVSYMKNPVQIFVGSLDLTAVHSVEQIILVMEEDEKFDYFIDFIKTTDETQKLVVFAGKKSKASYLASEMSCMGIYCSAMHGDLDQCDREQVIEDMINGTERILVATDIISRGIDIENITHVVNYDFPRNIEDYVHRVGRTGRAGRTGTSITFFTWSDARHAEELIRILQEANQTVPRELESMLVRYQKKAALRAAQGGDRDRRRY